MPMPQPVLLSALRQEVRSHRLRIITFITPSAHNQSTMQYDTAMKCISAELSRDLITLIFGERPDLEPISGSLPSTEHRADFLARVIGDKDFIAHIEFQTEHDPNMPMRMLSYYARILHTHKLPVYPIVVYLRQRDARIESTYNSSIGGRDVIAFKHHLTYSTFCIYSNS